MIGDWRTWRETRSEWLKMAFVAWYAPTPALARQWIAFKAKA